MPFHNNLNILNRYVYRIETIFQETINYKYVLNEYGLYDIVPLFTARSIHHTQTHSIIGNETANNLINNQLGGEGLQNLTALLQMEFIQIPTILQVLGDLMAMNSGNVHINLNRMDILMHIQMSWMT